NDLDNMFPYAFGDWGNFDFNIPLYCCFCDIIGVARPDYKTGISKAAALHATRKTLSANTLS
ncbi:MAG: hypothetical protein IJ402_00655, partial [Bacteroidales bacterium]|nr:hypothetical protein [Bacteroidales bacterium]